MELTELQKSILYRMIRHRYFGNRETTVDNVVKGLPKHLIKQGILVCRKKGSHKRIKMPCSIVEEIKRSLD